MLASPLHAILHAIDCPPQGDYPAIHECGWEAAVWRRVQARWRRDTLPAIRTQIRSLIWAVRRRLFLDHATVHGSQRDGLDKAPVASNLALIAGQGLLCLLVWRLFRELPEAFPTGGSSFSHVGSCPLSFVACVCSALPSSFVLLPHHIRRPDEEDKTSVCSKIAHGDNRPSTRIWTRVPIPPAYVFLIRFRLSTAPR